MPSTTISILFTAAMGLSAASASCVGPKVNAASLELVESFEGWRPDIYDDPTGNPTVGYGHLCSDSSCSDVKYSIPLSKADGQALLADDLGEAETCITEKTAESVKLNDNEYGAFVSWAFNEGCGNVESSTLISRLNNGENPVTVAEQELPQWVYSGGEKLDGLVRRRAAEVDLAKKASSVQVLPASTC